MKKIKLSLWLAAMCALSVTLQSCGDNDSTPKLQFTFDGSGETISLEASNLYLTSAVLKPMDMDNDYDYMIYTYCISDGTFTNATGNKGKTLYDYDNATYCLTSELRVTGAGEEMNAGEFPQYNNLSDVDGGNGVRIILKWRDEDTFFSTPNVPEDHSPIIVSGGVNDGEKMTLKFKGTLKYSHDGIEETGTGEFYYSGKVLDKRDL